jgi:hypothetical protein
MYNLKVRCVTNFLVAFATVLMQYVASQWIWSNSTKSKHYSPIYLVSEIVFFILWSFMMNTSVGLYNPVPIGYFIATPLLIIGGVPLNLLFCYLWKRVFSTEEEEAEDISYDKEVAQDLATIPVTKTTPSPSQEDNVSATVASADLEQGEQEQEHKACSLRNCIFLNVQGGVRYLALRKILENIKN